MSAVGNQGGLTPQQVDDFVQLLVEKDQIGAAHNDAVFDGSLARSPVSEVEKAHEAFQTAIAEKDNQIDGMVASYGADKSDK